MTLQDRERAAVAALGRQIGFGRLMQLAEWTWREWLVEHGHPHGGQHTVGPCAAALVPCVCVDKPSSCDWCCGTGRVTKRVREAAQKEARER